MNNSPSKHKIIVRSEFENAEMRGSDVGEIELPLSIWEKLRNTTAVRRMSILVVLAAIWQVYAVWLNNPLMFPQFTEMSAAFWDASVNGEMLIMAWRSVELLLIGYSIGVVIAGVLTTLAVSTRIGTDLLATLTTGFSPLPAIALLPLALLWFGLGAGSIIFVLVHSVLWPLALSTHSGFLAVSDTLRMAGHNFGLSGYRYVCRILIPAAFPSILSGLKIGWAFAWRTLIAAELVFGAASAGGGLGWFIFENRMELETPYVFAGLTAVIIIGLFVEAVIFRTIEIHTVRKWGMLR